MPAPTFTQRVRELQRQGLNPVQIAAQLGVDADQVVANLRDPSIEPVIPSSAKTFRTATNFLVTGPVDGTTVAPDAYVPLGAGQTAKIVAILANVDGGTSIDVTPRRNGAPVAGAGTFTADIDATWEGPTGLTVNLADGDRLDFTLSNPVGAPRDLSVAFVIEHTV